MSAPRDPDSILRELVQSPNNICFVCGPTNPHGLQIAFDEDDGVVRGTFEPGHWHQGWQGVVHGGILAAVLDEAMAYALYFRGTQGVTARMEVRYRASSQAHDRLGLEARIVHETARIADIEGRIERDGTVVAEATGRFMKRGNIDAGMLARASRAAAGETGSDAGPEPCSLG